MTTANEIPDNPHAVAASVARLGRDDTLTVIAGLAQYARTIGGLYMPAYSARRIALLADAYLAQGWDQQYLTETLVDAMRDLGAVA